MRDGLREVDFSILLVSFVYVIIIIIVDWFTRVVCCLRRGAIFSNALFLKVIFGLCVFSIVFFVNLF